MPQLQLAFTKRIEIKNKLWVAKCELKKILEDDPQYTKATNEIATLQNQRKTILMRVKEAYPKLAEEIEVLMVDLKGQNETVSDIAVKDYLDKKDITIKDPDDPEVVWEPQLQVKYRKTRLQIETKETKKINPKRK